MGTFSLSSLFIRNDMNSPEREAESAACRSTFKVAPAALRRVPELSKTEKERGRGREDVLFSSAMVVPPANAKTNMIFYIGGLGIGGRWIKLHAKQVRSGEKDGKGPRQQGPLSRLSIDPFYA